ncbi:fasciclin domain-containing protein [uncultured Thiohalocapsa sp.]|uniref:fasciclin domain-containing protein n=1 Tax=uncultured Thiohalocapsa sp. TaxID=768990 RepID=UPI0025FEB66A|nr:fasciclin domain-containing protein [uncultured Thiohalocapsa sp.]
MTEESMKKRNLTGLALLLVIALGPLAALSFGSRYADEETLARAEAGDRNYDPPGIFADSYFGLPKLVGAAAQTTVSDITEHDALFQTFTQALETAGMTEVLQGPGPLTVFAPTDKAFRDLPTAEREALLNDPGRLVDVLSRHVVHAKLSATDLLQRDQVKTLGGETMPVSRGGTAITIGGADIVQSNLAAGNGVVHIVDAVNL